MNLNYEDIQAILKILDDAPYDELHLETKDFNLYLKRNNEGGGWSQSLKTLTAAKPLAERNQESEQTQYNSGKDLEKGSSLSNENPNKNKEPAPTEEGLIDVRAPMIGTFYRSPKPGENSFVTVGSKVEENTIIAIIEVMKLMSSIPAKINGEIREILVEDAQLIEKGQLMMRVKPASP